MFKLGQTINPDCTLCNANLGDVYLRIDKNAEAEAALRAQARSCSPFVAHFVRPQPPP